MSFSFYDFTAALKGGAPLSAEDVLAVRREVWPDGRISDDEARALFEIDRLAADPAPEWVDFFLEALCDHVVNGKEPKGYIDDCQRRLAGRGDRALRPAASAGSSSSWSSR